MQQQELNMHLRAGQFFGELPTCGVKIDYKSEESANRSAQKMSAKNNRKLEAYPCYWCGGWHIGRAMTEKEREIFSDPDKAEAFGKGENVKAQIAEPNFGIQIGEHTLKVHSRYLCEGEYCCIHNPSDHPLKDAPYNWRGDLRIMERFCEHGIGHPDPDDAEFRQRTQGDRYTGTSHGCDGCC